MDRADPSSSEFQQRGHSWKLALVGAFLLAIITSIPQIHLWYIRGSAWNGSCALLDPDELPYLAYTNALINGRPRRNDPYTGKDDSHFETLFSIQFLPPYTVALPARLLRISGDTAFMLLLPLATIAAVLLLWRLLLEVTGNASIAIVGALCVVSFGTAAAHNPLQILLGLETGYDPFPFLRRYIPAVAFPIFWGCNIFIWRALTRNVVWGFLAGLFFALLVYSYFFLWTAVVAWFITIIVLWFIARPDERAKLLKLSAILIGMGGLALVPYVSLLMRRQESMDRGQILELRHAPDLLRSPELYGFLVLIVMIFFLRRQRIPFNEPRVLFTASFAIAPFLVFNQQVLTGRSLQPFHYEEFAANYWVVVAALLALGILRRYVPKRVLAYLGVGGLGVAVMLGMLNARLMTSTNVSFDQVRDAALKLDQENQSGVVFASDRFLTHSIPAISRNPVLWARYLYTFSNIDSVEQKTRYYQYLYYAGLDEPLFARLLRDDFTSQWEVFGAERVNPILTSTHRPITEEEIQNATKEYALFSKSFNSSLAANPVLSYAVVSPGDNLSNLDQWYERDSGKNEGNLVFYRLRLKFPGASDQKK